MNDYKDFVTVESVYMKEKETLKDHYEMDVDSSGMPLMYKIIIQDWMV